MRRYFSECAMISGLVTQEQLDAALEQIQEAGADSPAPLVEVTDKQMAARLVETGVLHPYQADQLSAGHTKFNLGPYVVIDSIGQGGMGQVFKAEHTMMGRVVAVKVLPKAKTTPEAIANFTREIRVLAQLDHENLVRAFDAGKDGNVYYLITEYVPGTDLRRLIRSGGPLSMQQAATIISQAAKGLGHAHQQGLIHRDVKPGNILVTPEGHTKVSDLGLAGWFDSSSEQDSRAHKIVGTADYLSPEQIKTPWDLTPNNDLYGLGCTMYYAVTGKVPFPGGTTREKARRHCEEMPLNPRRRNPALSEAFTQVLANLMEKDRDRRIQTGDELVERLAPWVGDVVESALATGDVPPIVFDGPPLPIPPPLPPAVVEGLASRDTGPFNLRVSQIHIGGQESQSQTSQGTVRVAGGADETARIPSLPDSNGKGRRGKRQSLGKYAIGLLITAAVAGLAVAAFLLARALE
jgi:serine/threonine protein kinase